MSAPKVDVLAELDALIIIRASRAAQDNAPLTAVGDLRRAEAARAAAAELIEVARMVIRSNDMNRWGDSCQPIVNAAHAALARAGVAQ